MKRFILALLCLLNSQVVHSGQKASLKVQKNATEFYLKQSQKERKKFEFNEYEYLISGGAAFIIGNVGYMMTDSSVLKLTYTGIQTIGIINIGQGIYKMNSPSVKGSLADLLNNLKDSNVSKNELSHRFLGIFASENRAKRLSLFYSSSALALQYSFNALVYDSPGKLKNIYLFLSGVNGIIALYSGFYKSDEESYFFGDELDIRPFATLSPDGDPLGGAFVQLNY